MVVKHRVVAQQARETDGWVIVKEYPNQNTAQTISRQIRSGDLTSYGSGFDSKVHGTTVLVKWKGNE